jgi:hypothetical protein
MPASHRPVLYCAAASIAELSQFALSDCVAYPYGYGGYGYGYARAPAPAYYAAPTVVGGGWWGGGRYWR